jgi:hypothetical protein
MIRFKHKALAGFLLRFILVWGFLLLPVPYVPGAYRAVVSTATNAMLWAVDRDSFRIGARCEMPREVRDPWTVNLRLDDRQLHRSAFLRVSLRTFSYCSMAAFVALVVASRCRGLRRNLLVWGIGLSLMMIATTLFTALPVLARFGQAGALGSSMGLAVRTMYLACDEPVTVYVVALFVWWATMRLTRDVGLGAPARQNAREGS